MNVKLTPEKQIIGMVLVFVVVISVVALGIMWPTAREIVLLNKETTSLKNYLEQRYETAKNLRFTSQQLEEISAGSKGYEQYIFVPGDELKLITDLETLAAKHNISQKITAPDIGKVGVTKIVLSISANGAYDNILQYLTGLESIKYFLNIEKIRFEPAPAPRSNLNVKPEPTYNLQLTLGLYVAHK